MESIDAELLRGFKNGNPQAAVAVIEACYPPLLNFLLRLGCSRADAEDLAQESLLKALRGLQHGYEDRRFFRAWLFKIAKNTFLDHRKKAFNRWELSGDPDSLGDSSPAADGPEEALLREETAARVREAVYGLPEAQRICLVLRFYHGFSLKEIAEVAGCPPGTVKSRLFSAVKQLKARLEGVNEE